LTELAGVGELNAGTLQLNALGLLTVTEASKRVLNAALRSSRRSSTKRSTARLSPYTLGVRRVFYVLTLLTASVAASDTGSPTVLPDAPSAVLARRFHGVAKDISKTHPPLSEAASPDDANAQQDTRPSVLHRALKDQREIYTAPFHRRNLKWDLVFLAVTGGLIAGDRHVSGSLSPNHAGVSQHISDIGMYGTTASVAGLWLSSLKTKDEHANETAIIAAEAFGNTAAVVGVTQMIAGRERPTESNGNGRFWQNNAFGSSFPSAHSSFTWTMASVVAHEYPKSWVRWLVYGTATTVSVTRVTGLKHFPSDVAVGGTFGYLIGQQMFNIHSVRSLSFRHHSSSRSVKGP
jgi:hypothetical protein